MLDKHGKPLNIGDRVRWGSFGDKTVGTVRKIRLDRTDAEECVVDDGNPLDPDMETNGWASCAALTSRRVTLVAPALSADEVEKRDRAELARLLAKYPDAVATKEGK